MNCHIHTVVAPHEVSIGMIKVLIKVATKIIITATTQEQQTIRKVILIVNKIWLLNKLIYTIGLHLIY